MPPKTKTTKTKQYRADRSFNELNVGDVVEMADDHPYLQTGYMQPVEAEAKPEAAPEVTGMSTTTVSGSGASGANEGPAGAGAGTGSGSSS